MTQEAALLPHRLLIKGLQCEFLIRMLVTKTESI